jgi:hypothetical protein
MRQFMHKLKFRLLALFLNISYNKTEYIRVNKRDSMRNVVKNFILVLCINVSVVHADQLVTGNATNTTTTFNFPIGSVVYNPVTENIYFGAKNTAGGAGNVNNFSVSQLVLGSFTAIGLTPPTTIINISQLDQTNPLFDQGIRELDLMYIDTQELPIVVTESAPATVYMFERFTAQQTSILNFGVLNDALPTNPQPITSVHGLANDNQGHIFTLVTPSSNVFGDPGTGVAVLVRGFLQDGDKQLRVAKQVDAPTGSTANTVVPRSLPFDRTSTFLTFNNIPLASMQDTVVLHWDAVLNVLYIGIQAVAANSALAGVRALSVAHLEQNQLIITPIAPEAVFDATNTSLISARGANAAASIFSIKTMHTSGGIVYLVVLAGDPANPSLRIFPVINGTNQNVQGTIAAQSAQPIDIFSEVTSNVSTLVLRSVTTAAAAPSDLLQPTDAAGNVGALGVLPGPIQSIFVESDSVFVSIATATNTNLNGVYGSRAMLDINGKIIGWTNWQRTVAGQDSVVSTVVTVQNGTVTTLVNDPTNVPNTVNRTQWIVGSASTIAIPSGFVNGTCTENNITIQNAVYLPATVEGLVNTDILSFGLTDRVILVEMATIVAGQPVETPPANFNAITSLENGVVETPLNATVVEIAGPVLKTIGPVNTFGVAVNGTTNMAWLLVGGVGGLAILADNTGAGWNASTGLASHFTNISVTSAFRQIPSFTFVRKIIAVGNFLYVLTDMAMSRIDMTLSNVSQLQFNVITVATAAQLGVTGLTDMVISSGFALLGTTNGLFVVGAEKSIATVPSPGDVDWAIIPLPEGVPSIQQLVVVDQASGLIDVANNNGGDVCILDASIGNNIGRVHRLAVNPLSGSGLVSATQATLFNDFRVQKTPSQFLDFGGFRELYYTDGSLYISSHDQDNASGTYVMLIAPDEPTGATPYLGLTGQNITTSSNFSSSIRALIKLRAHGYSIVVDDTQIYVNQ